MSPLSPPRIVRKQAPKKRFKEHNYRDALPFLLSDFSERCAYSLEHISKTSKSGMEVDHHNPKLKGPKRHAYNNLFPASHICNRAKGQVWPTSAQVKRGLRFLNPCKEQDYGAHLYEDPVTHEIVSNSPTGTYHIYYMDLNNPSLIDARKRRSIKLQLQRSIVQLKSNAFNQINEVQRLCQIYNEFTETDIPPLPTPPWISNQVP